MNDVPGFRLQITTDSETVEKLKLTANESSGDLVVQSVTAGNDPTKLGFGFGEIFVAAVLVAKAYSVAKLAADIYAWFSEGSATKLTLRTPKGTLELRKNGDITQEDIQKFLEAAKSV